MHLLAKFWAFLRPKSYLDRKRSQRARDIIEMVMPARPLVAKHQKTAALHIELASEINWTPRRSPQSWRGR